jgi:hypothetical protein
VQIPVLLLKNSVPDGILEDGIEISLLIDSEPINDMRFYVISLQVTCPKAEEGQAVRYLDEEIPGRMIENVAEQLSMTGLNSNFYHLCLTLKIRRI